MRINPRKLVVLIIGIMCLLSIFSCKKVDNSNVDASNIKESVENVQSGESTENIERMNKYDFNGYTMDIPGYYVKSSVTPESVTFLANDIPIIINKTVIKDDYNEENIDKFNKNLYQSLKKYFTKVNTENVESVSFDGTKGLMCKNTGNIQNNEFIQETYILADDAEKSIYTFTIFCVNNAGENDKYLKEFEKVLNSLKKK